MASLQKSASSQRGQMLHNGMVNYGSGLVFGGNVYPVLVDGVPMQPPVAAHHAAVHQRMQMQQIRPQAPQPTQCHKLIAPQPPYQRSGVRTGTPSPAPSFICKPNQQNLGSCPGSQNTNLATMQQLQAQILQQQEMQAFGHYGNYNLQANAGGDSGSWNGYAMMQPADANRPYSFGWSLTD
ncbi:uncharacterized protein [Drosophila takahashii]|uniref:uncharacterized protein n=1 Tax=Drosophila takahashii TaxID=29030 RepID=UPI001CF8E2C7|nr:uncharacterized protein LOC108067442 [Drosophila takahashii]